MSALKELAYLIVESNHLEEWAAFGSQVLGADVARRADGSVRMRIDDHAQRVVVQPGAREDLFAAGFAVANERALASLEADLRSDGVEVQRGIAAELDDRGVAGLIWFRDPEGLRIEAVVDPAISCTPPRLPLVPGGFVTGDQGCGHIAISAMNLAACEAFYRETLSFTLSDHIEQTIQGMPVRVAFFHINPRHHTLGIAGVPAPKRLHHFMLQVTDLDAVGRALDRAKGTGTPIALGLGKHPNDQMVSFYATTPSGFAVEIGMGALEIRDEDAWQVRTYDALSEWGHGF
jgi:2,3-dihydroxybiphenyl 1,2-dioxygenase